jgi:hypothetical protein
LPITFDLCSHSRICWRMGKRVGVWSSSASLDAPYPAKVIGFSLSCSLGMLASVVFYRPCSTLQSSRAA